jgi:AraC-like DNA-binding protein
LLNIGRNYAEKLDVDALASIIGLSSSQLNRLFKARYQISTTEYIQRYRVHLASTKLSQTEQTIGDIAVSHGFYDQAHFTRVFKHWLGVTPNQYRRDSRVTPGAMMFDNMPINDVDPA